MDEPARHLAEHPGAPRTDEPASPEPGDGGLVRLRLDLAYDGTDFAGWARQPAQRTVQEVLENALSTVLRVDGISTTCAGRTDAGVHARGQVVHVDVPGSSYAELAEGSVGHALGAVTDPLARRLSGILPPDVRVRAVRRVPRAFDARFSALARRYVYRVSDAAYGVDPLRRHEVLWCRQPLDLTVMDVAAAALVGEHDFAAFCRRREGATTVRTLSSFTWRRDAADLVTATVEADAFCHTMVRSLVGALLAVGTGRRPVEWPAALLALRERSSAAHVAPAHGLTLEHVHYPPDAQLAQRAVQTRRRREAST